MINDKASDVTEWPTWLTPYDGDQLRDAQRDWLLRMLAVCEAGSAPPTPSDSQPTRFDGPPGCPGNREQESHINMGLSLAGSAF